MTDIEGTGEHDSRRTDEGHPKVEFDSLAQKLQQRRLAAKMYGARSEPIRFGRYSVLDECGHGGMGVVYSAIDHDLNRKVAIKKLHGKSDPKRRDWLVREAQALAKLAHPNVVPIHEISEDAGAPFIVMEYVEGVTLREWLAQASRSHIAILAVFKAAAQGLIAAHAQDVTHRDFKPDNVMVGDDGRVRVMDFGLARFERQGEKATSFGDRAETQPVADRELTKSGALLGTLRYMAPEQLRGKRASAGSDQFAYCTAIYEALYRELPFGGKDPKQRVEAIEQGEIHQPPMKSAVPTWLRRIVMRGLEFEADERFESMQALLDTLEAGEQAADPEGREPPDYVFVAHGSVDKRVVRRLCEDLLDHGVRPWLDIWDLRPEPDCCIHMYEALRSAPAVLICHGPSGWSEQDHDFAEVLNSRIESDPVSVYRVGLPGMIGGPLPVSESCEGVDLNEEEWEDTVTALAQLVGVDRERMDWLGHEARHAGLSRRELAPYRGLEAFKERDARWMFGRETEIEELLAPIRAGISRFLTMVGPSGSGKSSLVLAGVCPALRNGALGDGRVWEIAVMRPGEHPCGSLARALLELQVSQGSSVTDEARIEELRAMMLSDNDTLRVEVSRIVSSHNNNRLARNMLLIVDQLELLFTEADLGQEAMAFINNVVAAAQEEGALWIMATLRADFLDRCLKVGTLALAIKSGIQIALSPMSEHNIRAAIERPAKRVGYSVESKLVEKLVNDVVGHGGRLPLLQHVLRELWERRDEQRHIIPFSAYAETGGLEGAIAVAAEKTLSGLRTEVPRRADLVTRRVMTRLVHLGETSSADTGRCMSLSELGTDDYTRLVLDAFVKDARVLVAGEANGIQTFELAHDALLREWTTLKTWLDANREALRVRQALAKDAGRRSKGNAREYLWRKGRVQEAKRILKVSTVELNDIEHTFLKESQHRARIRDGLVFGSLATGLVAAWLVNLQISQQKDEISQQKDEISQQKDEITQQYIMVDRRSEDLKQQTVKTEIERDAARLEAKRALSRQLAAISVLANSDRDKAGIRDDLAVLSAVSAVSLEASPMALQSLRLALDADSELELRLPGGHNVEPFSLAFVPDQRAVATGSRDGAVQIWDLDTGAPTRISEAHHDGPIFYIFVPDGITTISVTRSGEIGVWPEGGGLEIHRPGHADQEVTAAAVGDGKLAIASGDTLEVWDIEDLEAEPKLLGHEISHVHTLTFTEESGMVLSGHHDQSVGTWPIGRANSMPWMQANLGPVTALALGGTNPMIVVGTEWGLVQRWEFSSRKPRGKALSLQESPVHIAIAPDGQFFYVITNSYVQMGSMQTGKLIRQIHSPGEAWVTGAISPDGKYLGALDRWAREIRIWRLQAPPTDQRVLREHEGRVTALAVDPAQEVVASGSTYGSLILWNFQDDSYVHKIVEDGAAIRSLAYSADGAHLASGAHDGTVTIWDMSYGRPIIADSISNTGQPVTRVSMSGSGDSVYWIENDSILHEWDLEYDVDTVIQTYDPGLKYAVIDGVRDRLVFRQDRGVAVMNLANEDSTLFDFAVEHSAQFALNKTGDVLVVVEGQAATIIDLSSGVRLETVQLAGHKSYQDIAVSPDGSLLARAADSTGLVVVWDLSTGQIVASMKGHRGGGNAVTFTGADPWLLSAADDTTVHAWNLDAGVWVDVACNRVNRGLTSEEKRRLNIADDVKPCPEHIAPEREPEGFRTNIYVPPMLNAYTKKRKHPSRPPSSITELGPPPGWFGPRAKK